MTTRGKSVVTDRDSRVRKMFRSIGWDVQSVSWIRSHDGEFMVVKCWPSVNTAHVVQLLTKPTSVLRITRIHIGRETYPGQPPQVRVYVAWEDEEGATA